MKPHVITSVLVPVLLSALAGCFAPDGDGGSRSFEPSGSEGSPCRRFTTCGSCTPVLGCGWCSSGDKGMCADQPNECAGAMSFAWTWESSGCPADAGSASDGGPWLGSPVRDASYRTDVARADAAVD